MAARFLADLAGTLQSSFRVGTKKFVVSGTAVEVRQWTGGALADWTSNKLTTSDLVVHTNTENGTSGTTTGLSVNATLNPAGASSAIHRGIQTINQTQAGNAQNFTGRVTGIHGRSQHNGTGTVAQAIAFNALVQNTSTGIITEGTAVYISTPVITAGSITTSYGLYIEAHTGGGTNYAIYTNAGKVRIGDTSSDNNTYVNNSIYTAGGIGCQGAMVVGGTFHAAAAAQFDSSINEGLVTVGTSSTATAVTCTHTANPPSASTAVLRNLFAARTLNTNTQNLTDATASLIGLSTEARHEGTGIVTAMAASTTQIKTTNSSGTVTSGFGLRMFDGSKSVGTTIGTLYGLYVDSQTVGTLNYAIFTNTGIVRLGDRTLINTSTNDGVGYLQVNGSVSFLAITAPGSPVNGGMWYDSTQKSHTQFAAGIAQYGTSIIFTETADQTVQNTAVETTMIGTGVGTTTLPANFWTVGKSIRLRVRGLIQFSGAGSGATFKCKFGSIVLATSAALVFAGTSASPGTISDLDVIVTCRSTGATGTLMAQGFYTNQILGLAAGVISAAAVTVDTTASSVIDMTITWTTASATRIHKTTNVLVEVLG